MNEPENFLTRWSRRKRVADAPDQPAADWPAQPNKGEPAQAALGQPAGPGEVPAARTGATKPAAQPVFDPASLPSLDSIGANSDISAFLKPGVPGELKLAALRRAWSADPAIANFVGLQENDWDFNDPTGVFGFGELAPGTDVKKMVSQLFGEAPRQADAPADTPALAEQPVTPSSESSERPDQVASNPTEPGSEISGSLQRESFDATELVRRDKNTATQNENSDLDESQLKRRRSQGSALPH